MPRKFLFLAASIALTAASPAAAQSKAAAYLIQQEIAEACESKQGTVGAGGAIERDLDGDGALDLIIAHDAIHCSGSNSRNLNCGMQVCSVTFYLRRGQLLRKVHDMLGAGVQVGRGAIPEVYMYAHGGRRGSVRWNGHGFRYR